MLVRNDGTINNAFHLPSGKAVLVFSSRAALRPSERAETPPQPFASIPFCPDRDFIDRGDLLDQVDRICSESPRRVALVGMGGVGKSQLAIEYAHRISEGPARPWVFWVHAGTRARVEEGFRSIADAVKLAGRNQPKADIPLLVHNWLSNERNGRWVMVIDSADDCDVFLDTVEGACEGRPLSTYLPQSRNGSIIITTRDKRLANRLTGKRDNAIEVGPMTETEAVVLLKKKLGSAPHWDSVVAEDLVQALDLVPLAISQAAAYIQAMWPRSSLEKYLDAFRESERKRMRLLEHDAGDLRRDGGASNSIFTTWRISFDYIRSKRPSAADLLALMSFFDRQGIPEWVLKGNGPTEDAASETSTEDMGSDSDDGNTDGKSESDAGDDLDSRFEEDVGMLRDYCLVTTNEQGDEFEMHGLVQLSTRKWLTVSGQQEMFKQQYIKRMASAFPTGAYETWTTCRSLFAHAQVAVDYPPNADGVEEWATLLHNAGWYAWLQGRYDVAEQMVRKACKAREKRFGKEDMVSLSSTSLFAWVIKDRGRWDEAEMLQVQVMETYKTKLRADHPDTLISMNNLASIYRRQGRWDKAEMLQVQVMETHKTKLGPDHPDTLLSMNNLASIYWDQGRWDEAEMLQVQVMETRKNKLGPDHPNTLASMANLASTYWKQGRWDEAEMLFMQVMETHKIKLGPDHPDTLISMANLASTYWNQGRWDEAEMLQVQVMENHKIKLGPDHPGTLISINNLASTYQNQGRWDEAEILFMQVTETRKIKLGADHPNTLTSMGNLASTFWKQGRWDEAEILQVQVMETYKTKLGADHPDTLMSMNNLALTWKILGRHEDALALMKSCVLAGQRVLVSRRDYFARLKALPKSHSEEEKQYDGKAYTFSTTYHDGTLKDVRPPPHGANNPRGPA
ncbi:hypothetical protein S40293_08203 [Stachybotrys chartarum IBT 40293]|nr:hypothetical protein S40293_08203 [Stachybotrys chartarum IBT 40293]